MNAKILYLCALLLFLLHQDFWFWDDARLVFGAVPVGFFYHIVYCLAASGLLFAMTRLAWPSHLEDEVENQGPSEGRR